MSGNPAIGLFLGTVARTQSFNPPGIAALCSVNLGEVMAQVDRYKQLTCPEEIVQRKSKGEWTLRFRFLGQLPCVHLVALADDSGPDSWIRPLSEDQ